MFRDLFVAGVVLSGEVVASFFLICSEALLILLILWACDVVASFRALSLASREVLTVSSCSIFFIRGAVALMMAVWKAVFSSVV